MKFARVFALSVIAAAAFCVGVFGESIFDSPSDAEYRSCQVKRIEGNGRVVWTPC